MRQPHACSVLEPIGLPDLSIKNTGDGIMKMSHLPPRPHTVADMQHIVRPGMVRFGARADKEWNPASPLKHRVAPKSAHAKSVAFTLPSGETAQPVKERPQSVGAIKLNSEGLPVLMEPSAKSRLFRRPYRSPSAPEILSQKNQLLGNRPFSRKSSFPTLQRPHTSDGASDYLKQRARREFEEAAARASDFCKRAHDEGFFYRATEVPQDVELITARVASGRVLLDTTPNGIADAKEQSYFVDPLSNRLDSHTSQDNSTGLLQPSSKQDSGANSKQRTIWRLHARSSNSTTASPNRDRPGGGVTFDTEMPSGDNNTDVNRLPDHDEAPENGRHRNSDKKMLESKCKVSEWLESVDQFQGIENMDIDTSSDTRTTVKDILF